MRYSIKLDCKTHHVSKDGTFPILLRVSLNGEHDYFNIGKKINEKHYDKKEKCVAAFKGSRTYESVIDSHKVRIEKIIDDFDKRGEKVSLARIKELYEKDNGVNKEKCFYSFVQERLDYEIKHKKIKPATIKYYKGQFTKIKKYKRKLSIYDIDEKFVDEYATHISDNLVHSKNSVYHAKNFLRKYTNRLYAEGKISTRPFATIEVGSTFESKLQFLLKDELTLLHDLYDSQELLKIVKVSVSKYARYKEFHSGERLQKVLRYFLISCYTGFRHSDIKTLKREHIVGKEIIKQLVKGEDGRQPIVTIPIENRLYTLLDMGNPKELLFENPVMENSQTNKYLKEIIRIAKIDKHITFHKARYTFGIISLLLGIPIEVIRAILGHADFKTTLRYAKVIDELKNKEMKKWNKLKSAVEKINDSTEIFFSNCETLFLKI